LSGILEKDLPKPLTTFGARPVVIFISGWSGPGLEWHISPIKHKLDECGYETRRFNPRRFGIDCMVDAAQTLAVFVERFTQEGRPVYLIGHSMGGLVAKYTGDLTRIDGVVTIASPHCGTVLAHLAPWSESARQMCPNHPFIDNNKIFPSMSPMLSIACRFDELVIPRSSAVHPASDHVEWVNHNHVSVMFSRRIANMIVNYLKSWT
jgi:pimeloyl-ACP methyl ester carboxylesterase